MNWGLGYRQTCSITLTPASVVATTRQSQKYGGYRVISQEQNEIKRLVFRLILFGRVRPGDRRWRAFKQRWPSVANPLELIKEDDHGTTARACQRIESHIMIEGACRAGFSITSVYTHPDDPRRGASSARRNKE